MSYFDKNKFQIETKCIFCESKEEKTLRSLHLCVDKNFKYLLGSRKTKIYSHETKSSPRALSTLDTQ